MRVKELEEEKTSISPQTATHFMGEPQENNVSNVRPFMSLLLLQCWGSNTLGLALARQVFLVVTSLVTAFLFSNIVFTCILSYSENKQTRIETWPFLRIIFDLAMCHFSLVPFLVSSVVSVVI